MEADLNDRNCLFPPDTKVIHFNGSPTKYTALLRSKCKSKDEFRQNWLKQYEKLAGVAMRVLLTRPKRGKTVVYKAAFRCQHNTYPGSHQRVKSPHRKHTGCPAILKVTIKASPENRRVRSADLLRGEYPTIISLNHDHNHGLPKERNLINESWFEKIQSDAEIQNKLEKNEAVVIKELDWDSLKLCWRSFMEKWESSSSVHLYKALWKATSVLVSCKTVNGTIAALNSIRRKSLKRKKNTEALVQLVSESSKKLECNQLKNEKQTSNLKFDISNSVDEMLVIDQGWIV